MAKDDGKKRKAKDDGDSKARAGDASAPMGKAQYLAELEPLELALNNLARWLQHTGRRLAVVFEGRDTAAATDVLNILLTGTLAHLTYKDKEMSVDLTRPNMSPLPGLAEALAGIPLAARDHELKLTMPTEGLPAELAGKTAFELPDQEAALALHNKDEAVLRGHLAV